MCRKLSIYLESIIILISIPFTDQIAHAQNVSPYQGSYPGMSGGINSVAYSGDGEWIAIGGGLSPQDDVLEVFRPNADSNKSEFSTFSIFMQINAVAFSPDGRILASASAAEGPENSIVLWDVMSGKLIRKLNPQCGVSDLAFFPTDDRIASVGTDGAIRIWNWSNGKLLHTFPARTYRFEGDYPPLKGKILPVRVLSIAVSPDSKFLASGTNGVKVWDVGSGVLEQSLVGSDINGSEVAISPDGKFLVSGGETEIQIWNTGSWKLERRWKVRSGPILAIAISPNGKELVTSGENGKVELWNFHTGNLLESLTAPTRTNMPMNSVGMVHSVAFSPAGTEVVLGCKDGLAYRWTLKQ